MQDEVTVRAARETQGWGLALPGEQAAFAHVRTLDKARQRTVTHMEATGSAVDHADWTIHVIPEDEDAAQRVRAAREGAIAAAHAQEAAARRTRKLVAALDRDGYKSADIAGLLTISRGRVSQLLAEARALTAPRAGAHSGAPPRRQRQDGPRRRRA